MTRLVALIVLGFVLCPCAKAEEPPKKLTTEERQKLETKWKELTAAGDKAYRAENIDEAIKAYAEALPIGRGLYPKDEFPNAHPSLALCLNNLGTLHHRQGKYALSEPLYPTFREWR